jgi:hypothetical protein
VVREDVPPPVVLDPTVRMPCQRKTADKLRDVLDRVGFVDVWGSMADPIRGDSLYGRSAKIIHARKVHWQAKWNADARWSSMPAGTRLVCASHSTMAGLLERAITATPGQYSSLSKLSIMARNGLNGSINGYIWL